MISRKFQFWFLCFYFSGFTWKEKTWNPNLISIQTCPRPCPAWSLWSIRDWRHQTIHSLGKLASVWKSTNFSNTYFTWKHLPSLENSRILLSLRFYVKSISKNVQVLKLLFLQFGRFLPSKSDTNQNSEPTNVLIWQILQL